MRNKIIFGLSFLILAVMLAYGYMSFNSDQVESQNISSARPNNSEPSSDSNSDLKNGLLYYNDGPQRDYNKAFKFFEKAAKTENADAFFYLGNCYLDGLGVPRDQDKAFYYFKKGANLNHYKAMNNLAFCYYNGIGVQSDTKLADYWNKEKDKLLPELPLTVTFSKDTYHQGTLATTYTLFNNAKFDSPYFQFKVERVSSVDRRLWNMGIQRVSKEKPSIMLCGGYIINNSAAVFNPGDTLIISKEGYRPKEIVCPNIFK
jgi:TPR repeat protein